MDSGNGYSYNLASHITNPTYKDEMLTEAKENVKLKLELAELKSKFDNQYKFIKHVKEHHEDVYEKTLRKIYECDDETDKGRDREDQQNYG